MPTCRYLHYLKPEHGTTHCGMDGRMNSIRGWVHGNHVCTYVNTYNFYVTGPGKMNQVGT